MPASQRRRNPGVIQDLLDHPYRFQFFQAMRILEHGFVRRGDRPGECVGKRVRFLNTLNLGFPASEIERLKASYGALESSTQVVDPDWQVNPERIESVEITPSFFGLLGGNGVLPLTYTERLSERETYHRDRAARAFLDIFSSRAGALFYAAWKKYQVAMQHELDGVGRLLPMGKALAGLGFDVKRAQSTEYDYVPDQAMAFYCAAIRHRPVSTTYLQRVLAEYFQVPVRIEQLVGNWHPIPFEQRACLELRELSLGRNVLVGERVWQRDLTLRLWLGPLDGKAFDDFLPGASGHAALRHWLTVMTGCSLDYEVRLIRRADQVNGMALLPDKSGRLAWDAFLITHDVSDDRTDASYQISTLY